MDARTKRLFKRSIVLASWLAAWLHLGWRIGHMAFKIIKEWLFSGLRRHRSRHGQIVVSGDGECIIVLRWRPTKLTITFTDAEPPIDPCHPHPHDTLDENLQWLGGGRWGVKIKWSVFATRHIKYEFEGIA